MRISGPGTGQPCYQGPHWVCREEGSDRLRPQERLMCASDGRGGERLVSESG